MRNGKTGKNGRRILAWLTCMVMMLSGLSYAYIPGDRVYAEEQQSGTEDDGKLMVPAADGEQADTEGDDEQTDLETNEGQLDPAESNAEETPSRIVQAGVQTTDDKESNKQQTLSENSSEDAVKEADSDNGQENSETDPQSTDSENESNSPEVANTETVITLNLVDGTLSSDAGWTKEDDGSYTYDIPEDATESLQLPVPTRTGYTFGGWKTADGTAISNDGGNYNLDLSQVNSDLTLTAVWQQVTQQYTINITKAVYTLPFKDSNNTLKLTHYNKKGEKPDVEQEIVPFLNEYVNTLTLEYTISYSDDNGAQQEISRTNVELKDIDWNLQNEDFSEVNSYLSSEFNGDTKNVYLNEDYLKQLIADYESSYTGNDKISGISEENIKLSDGYNKNTTALKIKLGSLYNKDSDISGNEDYMIDTVSPSNVQVNLFDYWQLSPFYYDRNSDTGDVDLFFNSKVNKGHGLVFFKNGPSSGTWNNWTGKEADVRLGIVKNTLTTAGFPQLNLKEKFSASGSFSGKYEYEPEESLQYLFDPNTVNQGDYGRAYSNVKGLFKINEDGNYYYSSHDNFAEYNYNDKSFNVYNAGGVKAGGSSPHGQFFPFNTANQVFKVSNGKLQDSGILSTDDAIDHYLGLSMSVDFQQPIDGMVSVGQNAKPMTFEFSGDDDVWIFIDGVLVADLGGIHDEASVEIDFSTGNITKYLSADSSKNRSTSTLKEMFDAAGKTGVAFNENTFAGNTTHTLQMFYLERGNYDSNLTLSFNLMEPVDSQIIKLDQDGNAVQNAKFALYEAKLDGNGQPILDNDKGTYEITGQAIFSNLETDTEGQVTIPANYDFSQHTYYVLKEEAPEGYFGPGDVLLRYDKYEKHNDGKSSGTNLLLVDNRWTTGAVGNFTATIYQSGDLHYDGDTVPIDPDTGQNGLILAVPMMKGSDGSWRPLYGSNMAGFETVSDADQRTAALKAALYQIFGAKYGEESEEQYSYGFQKWYMEWDEEMDRYQGVLNDLPGDATRYYWASNDIDADMSVAYYFLDLEKLEKVFGNITGGKGTEKLSSIAEKIYEQAGNSTDQGAVTDAVNKIVTEVLGSSNKTFGLLDVSLFNRTFASRIYVPNTQPDLRVRKLDQDGNAIPNVEFSLFTDPSCNGQAIAKGTTDSEGLLIFSETGTGAQGSALVNFEGNETYYLKETSTPAGYDENRNIIPVYVTEDGRVYASALGKDDGITVRKGLGKLVQTMAKYAGDGSIDGTLRDITGKLFTVQNFSEIDQAIQANTGDQNGEELDFCYGATNAILEYGTHQINGVFPNPYFEVDEGIAGIIVHQNYDAHQGDALYDTYAEKTKLENVNIRALFTGSTTVVVRNRKTDSQGSFSIKKMVSGTDIPENATFDFTVKIEKNDSATGEIILNNGYLYTVKDEDGTLETGQIEFTGSTTAGWKIASVTVNGNTTSSYIKEQNGNYYIQLQADQMITVKGIPFGLKVTAKETDGSANGYRTSVSVNNGQWSRDTTEASGVVEKPVGNPSFVFNNHKDKVANLELQKIVETGETDKAFTFNITLNTASGADLTGRYSWKVLDATGSQLSEGTINNGSLKVSLKNKEKVIISNLPIGSKYMITENTMGYTPSVTVNDKDQQVVNGSVSGTIEEIKENNNQLSPVKVVYHNVRSGSITITKRSGTGDILNGAGFTLYSVKEDGTKLQKIGTEQMTALAVRTEISEGDPNFDKETMRYNNNETSSYIVHASHNEGGTASDYFYYRFLTESEKNQYYNGTFSDSDNVEAIVEFDGITDFSVKYMIEETTVPTGYVKSNDIEDIDLPKDDGSVDYYDLLYTVTNHKQFILPTSGLTGIAAILGIGVALIGAAIVLWRLRKRAGMR